jgi:poly(A) polymerase
MLNTDKRIRSDKRVTPAFIYAAILWPAMHHRLEELKINGMSEFDAINDASQSIVSRQLQRIMIPKRFLIPMRQIWELQWRLPNRNGKRAYRLLEHPKFRAGFDFLLAREAAGEQLDGLGQWWEQFQHANEDLKAKMVNELNPSAPRKKRRRKNPTKRNDPQPNQP